LTRKVLRYVHLQTAVAQFDIEITQNLESARKLMDRSKIVAIVAGAISVILAIAYLLLVQLLDFRGEMIPAPQSHLLQPTVQVAQMF